jgi:hypothetical protein
MRLTAASVFVVRLIIRESATNAPGPSRKTCPGPRQVFGTARCIMGGTRIGPRHSQSISYAPEQHGSEEFASFHRF